tara:strand:+ start:443 stop:640 length:198 start_codon:yes stop_codon:yes gene_type:complete
MQADQAEQAYVLVEVVAVVALEDIVVLVAQDRVEVQRQVAQLDLVEAAEEAALQHKAQVSLVVEV